MVGTAEAAYLLGISCQRVRQLLKAGRIRGAVKVGRCWRIPLFNGMPRVKVIERGTKGTWRRRRQASGTILHVSKPQLDSDRKHKTNSPVIIVRQGSRTTHCRSAVIDGPSRILYQPDNPLPSCPARLWIEVKPHVKVKTDLFG